MKEQKTYIPEHIRHKGYTLKVPFGKGRFIWTRDPGEATVFGSEYFQTEHYALHRDGDGRVLGNYNLGSGVVTNVGVMAMSNDYAWAQNVQTLKLANNHMSGTGSSAAATDIKLGTTTSCPNPVAGAQSAGFVANTQTYKSVATVNYSGNLNIQEWGLLANSTLSATTGTPLTAVSTSTATATGTPYTASSSSVQGEQQWIINTGTTASWGLVISNSTSVLTLGANGTTGWFKVADGTNGTTPGSTEAFTLYPVMFDHITFASINVVNGDSIQFSFSLTINSGG